MTRLVQPALGTLDRPVPIESFPFVDSIEVEEMRLDPDEPSPCMSTARSVWYVAKPLCAGTFEVDLAGSTPSDPLVRLYRRGATPYFLGCASPAWNGNLTLEVAISPETAYLMQVGTSESTSGRVVVRVVLGS